MPVLRLLISMLLLGVLAAVANAVPRLTEAQAKQIVSDFCQAIAQPVNGPATATYPINDPYPAEDPRHSQPAYWGDRWAVVFPDQVEAEVDDATGVVCSYSNCAIEAQLGYQAEGTAMAEAAAIQRATSALQATLQTDGLAFDSADLVQESDPPLACTHYWTVRWVREYQGFPYRQQGATVMLLAETGTVAQVGLNYPSPPPAITALVITQQQADAIVSAVLAGAGVQNPVIDTIDTQIVQPNTFWQAGGSVEPVVGLSRLAYAYHVTAGEGWYEVWVDTQDGTVLGGELSTERLLKRRTVPRTPVRSLIRRAREVRVYAQQRDGSWSGKPIAVLSARQRAAQLRMLRAALPCRSAGPLARANYRLVLLRSGRPFETLRYMPRTGRLGAGSRWGVVPPAFRQWMARLARKGGAAARPARRQPGPQASTAALRPPDRRLNILPRRHSGGRSAAARAAERQGGR